MTAQQEDDTIDLLEKLNGTGQFLKFIAWAIGAMAVAGLSVAGWVWTVNGKQSEHSRDISELKPKVTALEYSQARREAMSIPSLNQIHELDNRLARIEEKFQNITEQNAMVIELLRKHMPQ